MKFIQTLRIIVSLLPVLIEAIKAVEAAIPGKGKGEQKLSAVREMLESVSATGNDLELTIDELWPSISRVITSLVKLFNNTDAFQKG